MSENIQGVQGKPAQLLGKRAGEDQKKALLSYLEENLPVARNQFEGSAGYKKLMTKWNGAAEALNEHGPAKKTGPQWKKFFEDWRIRIKKKYSAIKQQMEASGQNGVFIEHLNDLEQKLVGIVTLDNIDGDGTTEELGLANRASVSSEPSTSTVINDESNDSIATGCSEESESVSQQLVARKKVLHDDEMELLVKMAKLDEKRYELDLQRNIREEKAEQRATEDHLMKMEIYKAKLSVLQQQIGK